MHITMTITNPALMMPGRAFPSEVMILLSDLTRLKSRKTRKARSMRSCSKAPGRFEVDTPIAGSMDGMETATTNMSKRFHPDRRKWSFHWQM